MDIKGFFSENEKMKKAEKLLAAVTAAEELGYQHSAEVSPLDYLIETARASVMVNQKNVELTNQNASLKSSLSRSYEANDQLNDRYKDLAVMKHTRFNDDECWIFDEDNLEENHLESLVCPVVIRARKLREILSQNAELQSQLVAVQDSVVHGKCANAEPCATFCEAIATRKMFKQLQVERDGLAAQVLALKNALSKCRFDSLNQSLSEWAEIQAAFGLAPQHHLAARDAEVAKAAFIAGYKLVMPIPLHNVIGHAENYVKSLSKVKV